MQNGLRTLLGGGALGGRRQVLLPRAPHTLGTPLDLGNGENCYAIGRYLYREPNVFCSNAAVYPLQFNHIHCVKRVPSALVAVVATDIVKKLVFISCSNFNVNFACAQVHSADCCV